MWSIGKIAELLGVRTSTVRRLVEEGEIPAYKVGTRYRFKQSDIAAYLKSSATSTVASAQQVDEEL